jgi:glutamate synthase domain-containing protein 3
MQYTGGNCCSLGKTGRNFAGMERWCAYVLIPTKFDARFNVEMVGLESLEQDDFANYVVD